MNDNKTIRFIDSSYKELFRIPDGGNIVINRYDGEKLTRTCTFLDEYHTQIGKEKGRGEIYHICQFAELMEKNGNTYAPEVQLREAELTPFKPGEEKIFTYNREEGNTCIGHIAGDFGNDGERFYSNWQDRENGRNTPEFQGELHSAVYALRQSLLKDNASMLAHCQNHPEALLNSGDDYKIYGFELETDTRRYFASCFIGEYMRDARFTVYAYDKPAPVLEQERTAVGKPSVLKQIRKAQKAPKPPVKAKSPKSKEPER